MTEPVEGSVRITVCYLCRDYKECEYLRPGKAIDLSQAPEWICEICKLGWLGD